MDSEKEDLNNPLSKYAFFESISIEPFQKETIKALAWTRYDYEHTPFKAFKALPTYIIVHLPPP